MIWLCDPCTLILIENNPSGAQVGALRHNLSSAITADALCPCADRSSAAKVFGMYNKQFLVFLQAGIQLQ